MAIVEHFRLDFELSVVTDVTDDTDVTDVTDVTVDTDVTDVTDVTNVTDVTDVTDVSSIQLFTTKTFPSNSRWNNFYFSLHSQQEKMFKGTFLEESRGGFFKQKRSGIANTGHES